jgi:predicted ATP-grasp superfamily ATP-dependent carboligase
MKDRSKSVLIVGFNTRPLAYSLKSANYDVYAIDFFGDVDLYPNVKDSFVLTKELETNYESIKDNYGKLLSEFSIKMLDKYPEINYLIIGSGLDDAYEERETILTEIKDKNYKIKSLNNDKALKRARNIEYIYNFLRKNKYNVPFTIHYDELNSFKGNLHYPLIFKKSKGAGGLNVFKIENTEDFPPLIEKIGINKFNSSEWLIQEYIEGLPISCTTISNGKECEVISINHQIIGEQFLYPPKDFMYCGNIVPADLPKEDNELISKISKTLVNKLSLRGINGFDFVLKDHYPYLMEVNPRIPGSIRASEMSYDLNLLDLHVKSFDLEEWNTIKKKIRTKKLSGFSTKLIVFAPKEIKENLVSEINDLDYVHDKSEPNKSILKGEPLCTILYKGKDKQESYSGARNVVNKINRIIS